MSRDKLRELARTTLTYSTPTPARARLHEAVNAACLRAGKALAELLPTSDAGTAAIEALGLARMCANAAVSHEALTEEEALRRIFAAVPEPPSIIDMLSQALGAPVTSMMVTTKRWPNGDEDLALVHGHGRALGLSVDSVETDTVSEWKIRSAADADAADRASGDIVDGRATHTPEATGSGATDPFAGMAEIEIPVRFVGSHTSKVEEKHGQVEALREYDPRRSKAEVVGGTAVEDLGLKGGENLDIKVDGDPIIADLEPDGFAEIRPIMVEVTTATYGGVAWSDMVEMTVSELHDIRRDIITTQEAALEAARSRVFSGVDYAPKPDRTVVQEVVFGDRAADPNRVVKQLHDALDKVKSDSGRRKPELASMVEDVRFRGGWVVLHLDTVDDGISLTDADARKVAAFILGDPSQSFEQASDPGPAALDTALGQVVDLRIDLAAVREECDAWRTKAERSHKAAMALWGMLDDIDTLDDRVKDDYAAFRVRARAIQKKRERVMVSRDGQSLEYADEYKLDA